MEPGDLILDEGPQHLRDAFLRNRSPHIHTALCGAQSDPTLFWALAGLCKQMWASNHMWARVWTPSYRGILGSTEKWMAELSLPPLTLTLTIITSFPPIHGGAAGLTSYQQEPLASGQW